ncbi:hypothetical protein N9T73_00340 [bacterium]|nr:hypothetical protein [bacterium]
MVKVNNQVQKFIRKITKSQSQSHKNIKCKYCNCLILSSKKYEKHLTNTHLRRIKKECYETRKQIIIKGKVAFSAEVVDENNNKHCSLCKGTGFRQLVQCWKNKDTDDLMFKNTGTLKQCSCTTL